MRLIRRNVFNYGRIRVEKSRLNLLLRHKGFEIRLTKCDKTLCMRRIYCKPNEEVKIL